MNGQAHALRRFLMGRGAAPGSGSGTTLVVASGKGGVGTSTVAALLALRAAEEGRSTLLVDAEAGHGTLHLILGVEPGPGLAALRGGMLTPRDLLVPVVDRLQLVTAGTGQEELGEPVGPVERRALLRRITELYGAFDVVIVDAGSRLDGVLAACTASARHLLLVSAANAIALAATHALAKVVTARVPALPASVLVNGCDDATAMAAYGVLRSGIWKFIGRMVPFAGSIPEDAALRAAAAAGRPLQEAYFGSAIADAVRALDAGPLFDAVAAPNSAGTVKIPQL
ncbi:MAG TPA: P-loop NTPase [Nannocystis sp.]|jgi:flagellar biosynthesis protein FlhG